MTDDPPKNTKYHQPDFVIVRVMRVDRCCLFLSLANLDHPNAVQ